MTAFDQAVMADSHLIPLIRAEIPLAWLKTVLSAARLTAADSQSETRQVVDWMTVGSVIV